MWLMGLESSILLTDLYQLTMLQGYVQQRMEDVAVFEFFVRHLPSNRGFLVAAGLEQVLQFLERLRVRPEELEWIAQSGRFSQDFVRYLEGLRFSGDVHAMPEGTVCFSNEPMLRVTAPLPQAQLVESRLINLLHFQTLIASKAARSVLVAPGKLLVDFGMRRSHGAEAALLAARASYLAGFSGTSTVLAAQAFGIPVYGTVAHSFIEAHDDETQAFADFAHAQPGNVVLLLDTYDTEEAAKKVVALAPRLRAEGIAITGVRLDSGDLAEHARAVRQILDAGALREVRIFASGNLDEEIVRELVRREAPIDGFGIGTRMDTSADGPYLDCAYKLQEYAGRPRRKRSEGKPTWPGRKQVYRHYGADGCMARDVVTLETDAQDGEPLLQPVMRGGKRVGPPTPLVESRRHAAQQLSRLPASLRQLNTAPPYPVELSQALHHLVETLDAHRNFAPQNF
jgi:nicotinate phosphoribosyltransferase